MKNSILVTGLLLASLALAHSSQPQTSSYGNPFQKSAHCFCKLEGRIDDCECNVESVDHFNNQKLYPLLQGLLEKSYFRYFQYNPHRKCPFWDMSTAVCSSGTCGVKPCSKEAIPDALASGKTTKDCPAENPDDQIDSTVSDDVIKSLQKGKDESEFFCDLDAETGSDCEVVDLTINPERYTGYKDEHSWRIWRAIYEENCFKPTKENEDIPYSESQFHNDKLKEMCLEKRAFFRAVSGLHTSITIHLTSRYPVDKIGGSAGILPKSLSGLKDTKYGPNLGEFLKRFDPDLTNNQGSYWLRNVYFVYLLELRAIVKAAPAILNSKFEFGNSDEDKETLEMVKKIIEMMKSFPDQFDESGMFSGSLEQSQLKAEFRDHFYNITRIFDCVVCDKCKLWGKLQMTGLATALKVLFADEQSGPLGVQELTRHEIVALFNAFGRISTSIRQLEIFREMIQLRKKDEL